MKLKCELIISSDVEHLRQIYTGFNLLHQKGFLELTQTIPAEFLQNKSDSDRWVDYNFFNAKVILNGKITIIYDTHDWNWIDENVLSESDFYFKRSYDENYVSSLGEKNKVFPLGLNYSVSSSTKDFFKVRRAQFYNSKDKLKTIAKGLKIPETFGKDGEVEQIKNLEALPDFAAEPKIIFMTRVWNPENVESKQTELIEKINATRADCVRILKKNFGDRFFGGLAHDEFAAKNFNDCLLPDQLLSNKKKYFETLKDFPICVATTGLNNSIGWKLAEYVALSKAVITEPLFFRVPGNFAPEKNYLEFSAPETLLDAATRLFENKVLRNEMMMNNYRYYQAFLRPDSLVLNTLATVFQHAKISF